MCFWRSLLLCRSTLSVNDKEDYQSGRLPLPSSLLSSSPSLSSLLLSSVTGRGYSGMWPITKQYSSNVTSQDQSYCHYHLYCHMTIDICIIATSITVITIFRLINIKKKWLCQLKCHDLYLFRWKSLPEPCKRQCLWMLPLTRSSRLVNL